MDYYTTRRAILKQNVEELNETLDSYKANGVKLKAWPDTDDEKLFKVAYYKRWRLLNKGKNKDKNKDKKVKPKRLRPTLFSTLIKDTVKKEMFDEMLQYYRTDFRTQLIENAISTMYKDYLDQRNKSKEE